MPPFQNFFNTFRSVANTVSHFVNRTLNATPVKSPTSFLTPSKLSFNRPASGAAPERRVPPASGRVAPRIGGRVASGQPFRGGAATLGATSRGDVSLAGSSTSRAIHRVLRKHPISAEMRITASGSRLAQSVLIALQHEGKPSYLSNEKYLQRFARTGWDKGETNQAYEMLALWNKRQEMRSRGGLVAQDTPMPESTATPQLEFVDPCQGRTGDELAHCYRETLASYGVGIMDNNDLTVEELRGVVQDLEDFSSEELAIVLQGVDTIGNRLVPYVSANLGGIVTPDEAFRLIYGSVEFGYDVESSSGLTVRTGENPTDPRNTVYILLDDSSFGLDDGNIGFNTLPDSFVVAHELGHAFAIRQGNTTIDTTDFVRKTGSLYNNAVDDVLFPIALGQPTYGLRAATDASGKQRTDPQTGYPLYILPSGGYIALGFTGGSLQQQRNYFFNEFKKLSPDEGFADAFSHFMLDPDQLEAYSVSRFQYVDENIEAWLRDILCRNGEINCN